MGQRVDVAILFFIGQESNKAHTKKDATLKIKNSVQPNGSFQSLPFFACPYIVQKEDVGQDKLRIITHSNKPETP
eukprot:scaffold4442_cov125-Amphora_coffeaeformis.AAC.12